MVGRVCRELGGTSGVIVLNDEAHHCYRGRFDDPEADAATEKSLTGDEKDKAKRNTQAARIWFRGLVSRRSTTCPRPIVPVALGKNGISMRAFRLHETGSPPRTADSDRWFIGSRTRNAGSLYADIWTGTGAALGTADTSG